MMIGYVSLQKRGHAVHKENLVVCAKEPLSVKYSRSNNLENLLY